MNPKEILEFFKSELLGSSDDIQTTDRLVTLDRIALIASSIGPSKTRRDLLSILRDATKQLEDDEEALHGVAAALLTLADFVGGEEYFYLLVPILANLCVMEEAVLRNKAIESLRRITTEKCTNPQAFVRQYLFPVVEIQSKHDWFAARSSACQLIPVCYPHASEAQQLELRRMLCALAADDTPMVKRAAAETFQPLFAVSTPKDVTTGSPSLLSSFQKCWADNSDVVRAAALSAAPELSTKLSTADHDMSVHSVVTSASRDRSWKVRLALAKVLEKILTSLVDSNALNDCGLPALQSLLGDTELEVREVAFTALERSITCPDWAISSQQILNCIVPVLGPLAEDPSVVLRSGVCRLLGPIGKAVGPTIVISQIIPIIKTMATDESPIVRLSAVGATGPVISIVGDNETAVSGMSRVVQTLIKDPQWRVRMAVLELLPVMAKHAGVVTFEKEMMKPLLFGALQDAVYAVREAAIACLRKLPEAFGVAWAFESLLPQLTDVLSFPYRMSGVAKVTTSYLSRITMLHVLSVLAQEGGLEKTTQQIVPVLLLSAKDAVPNVRLATANVFIDLYNRGAIRGPVVVKQILPALKILSETDADMDVAYFAMKALAICERC